MTKKQEREIHFKEDKTRNETGNYAYLIGISYAV